MLCFQKNSKKEVSVSFQNYIKAVGTGPKGNRDLTFEEAKDMMRQLLHRDIDDALISAFLLGWRLKPESIEELRGAVAACDTLIKHSRVANSIELGYAFDGKSKYPYLLDAIAKHLADKLQLSVATDCTQAGKNGVSINELFASKEIAKNVHIFQREKYLPQLHQLTPLRNLLSLRTAINTFEKLPNVAQSEFAITGVHHKPYVEKYMKVFALRYKRFAVIQGSEGSCEVFKNAKLWICTDADIENIEEFFIDVEAYGIQAINSKEKLQKSALIEQSFSKDANLQKLAQLNAAILLFVAQKVESIEEGFKKLS